MSVRKEFPPHEMSRGCWQLPPLHPLHEHLRRRSPWLTRIQSKPFQVISGNRTQVGACCIYFVLLFKPNCPSLPSYVAGEMGASSRGPAESKWKTSQRKQQQSWACTSRCVELWRKDSHPCFSPRVSVS